MIAIRNIDKKALKVLMLSADIAKSNRRLHQIAQTWEEVGHRVKILSLREDDSNQKFRFQICSNLYRKIKRFLYLRKDWKSFVISKNFYLVRDNFSLIWIYNLFFLPSMYFYLIFRDFFSGNQKNSDLPRFRDDPASFIDTKTIQRIEKIIKEYKFDVIILENYYAWLSIANYFDESQFLVYDAPEYARGTFGLTSWQNDFISNIEQDIFSRIDVLSTLSIDFIEKFRSEYEGNFKSIVISNAFAQDSVKTIDRDEVYETNSEVINSLRLEGKNILLCHGSFIPNRNLIEFADWFLKSQVDNWVLIYMGDGKLLENLVPMECSSFKILKPVTSGKILDIVRMVDICLIPYAPRGWNHIYCTPNKFFDAVHANKPVLVCESLIQLGLWINQYNLGSTFSPEMNDNLSSILTEVLDSVERREYSDFLNYYGWPKTRSRIVEIALLAEEKLRVKSLAK